MHKILTLLLFAAVPLSAQTAMQTVTFFVAPDQVNLQLEVHVGANTYPCAHSIVQVANGVDPRSGGFITTSFPVCTALIPTLTECAHLGIAGDPPEKWSTWMGCGKYIYIGVPPGSPLGKVVSVAPAAAKAIGVKTAAQKRAMAATGQPKREKQ